MDNVINLLTVQKELIQTKNQENVKNVTKPVKLVLHLPLKNVLNVTSDIGYTENIVSTTVQPNTIKTKNADAADLVSLIVKNVLEPAKDIVRNVNPDSS